MSQRRQKRARHFEVEFKVEVSKRLLRGESASAVAKEVGVRRKSLYEWKRAYERGGETLLRGPGRPSRQQGELARDAERNISELSQARKRIEDLERKVGQQELELDFFVKALRCVEATAQSIQKRSASSSKSKPRKAN